MRAVTKFEYINFSAAHVNEAARSAGKPYSQLLTFVTAPVCFFYFETDKEDAFVRPTPHR